MGTFGVGAMMKN